MKAAVVLSTVAILGGCSRPAPHLSEQIAGPSGPLPRSVAVRQVPESALPRDSQGYNHVSIVAILADPERWDGKAVDFAGFVHWVMEGAFIYLDRDSMEHGILANSIELDVATCENLDTFGRVFGKACGVRGVIVASEPRHLGVRHCTLKRWSWYSLEVGVEKPAQGKNPAD